jgi:hypothetical protein
MNTSLRLAYDRGHVQHDWLDSRHSFSFGSYRDPNHMGFSDLRVINEDQIAPGAGFPMHAHANMEIFTYVMSGAVEHRDSMGNHGIIGAGELQYMSAGSGVTHSEYNASKSEALHLYQIWLRPEEKNLSPQYQQLSLKEGSIRNSLRQIAHSSKKQIDENSESFPIRQDASIFVGSIEATQTLKYIAEPKRALWLQMIEGRIEVDSKELQAGDAIGLYKPKAIDVRAIEESLFLLFDLRDTAEAHS